MNLAVGVRLGAWAAREERQTRRPSRAERREVEVDQLDRLVGEREAVELVVVAVETFERHRDGRRLDGPGRERNILLVVLADVAHADRAHQRGRAGVPFAEQRRERLGGDPVQPAVDGLEVERIRAVVLRPAPVDAAIGDERAVGRREAREGGDDDRPELERACDRGGVKRPGAAEGDQLEVARVAAAFDNR